MFPMLRVLKLAPPPGHTYEGTLPTALTRPCVRGVGRRRVGSRHGSRLQEPLPVVASPGPSEDEAVGETGDHIATP